MTLAMVIGFAVTLQAAAVSLLIVAGAQVARSAASARAVAAEVAWRTAVADAAPTARTAAAEMMPGAAQPVSVAPPGPEWEVAAEVQRAPLGRIAALRLTVVRRLADGRPDAARQGTLLLPLGPADTAVIREGTGSPP